MKRLLAIVLCALLLSGCGEQELDIVMQVRENIKSGCSFSAQITADYGEQIYTFSMDCQADELGNMTFTVTHPQTISGITGRITDEGGQLTFDDQALAFEMMADGQITPVSASWILVRTLRGGYLKSCAQTDDGYYAIIDDSYEEDALQLDIWLDPEGVPQSAEILWDGRRILSIAVSQFAYL